MEPPPDSFPARSSILNNQPLMVALISFLVAQSLKVVTTWYKEKRWEAKRLLGSGGMPSSHAATVMGLAAGIGLKDGPEGSLFAIALVLAIVVMYDASGVRLQAGRQAEDFLKDADFKRHMHLSQSREMLSLLFLSYGVLFCIGRIPQFSFVSFIFCTYRISVRLPTFKGTCIFYGVRREKRRFLFVCFICSVGRCVHVCVYVLITSASALALLLSM